MIKIVPNREKIKMAIFHLDVRVIGGKDSKRTATQAAAYRHRLKTEDGKDYSLKGGLVAEMFLTPKDFFFIPKNLTIPDGADLTPEKIDPMRFWEAVDRFESQKRKDSQKAREVILSLHKELTLEENKRLVKKFVEDEFISLGMTADVVIHQQPENPDNIHAHIMLTTRKAHSYGGFLFGFNEKKERDWNLKYLVYRWRENWAKASNLALKKHGKAITEKSYMRLYEEALERGNLQLAEIYGQLMQCKTHERRFKKEKMSKGDINLSQERKRLKLELDALYDDQMIFILKGQQNGLPTRNRHTNNRKITSATIRRPNLRTRSISNGIQLNDKGRSYQEFGFNHDQSQSWGRTRKTSDGYSGNNQISEKSSSTITRNHSVWDEIPYYSREDNWLERALAEKERKYEYAKYKPKWAP